ncbi:aminotransferase class I/II-fold pyridoxal phosphate-dependent enzyme [Paenibacillus senegalensis]|uniref:aminotransferase class I/II-fold pyridoxal phosphate-dependent enzyme n=1 Tax=Paenibacillus senegalensis TaxID=1465766 RepID=UPI0002897AD8|nr:aminotransferase class I/II-fold pyridoxal phosphate-dependent enzyme [Paenibacillus senegalensis]
MDNNGRAPLYERLQQAYFQRASRFHVPGHKGGRGLVSEVKGIFEDVMEIDYTEVTGLDDLHHPQGVIQEAQQLAAACFGAEATFFLVNGSTVGNLALILSVCQRNDLVLVQRNVHKSILHGLMLAGAQSVFLPPQIDPTTGIAAGVSLKVVEQALLKYPEARAVILTNPNYYGMGNDLNGISELVHSYGKPLIVDEAHGAHFGFHPELPGSALSMGADAVVQSTHKMLSALTMGSMLHIQGERIDREKTAALLAMLQSSSPSYPIMASLDLCRASLENHGEQLFAAGLRRSKAIKEKISTDMPWFSLVQEEKASEAYDYIDPFKITIRDATGTLNGYELQQQLEDKECLAEMADPDYALLVCSYATSSADTDHLFQALKDITSKFDLRKKEKAETAANNVRPSYFPPIITPVSFDMSMLSQAPSLKQAKTLQEAVGWRSAESIIPYPPGIPVIYPGEVITEELIAYLNVMIKTGARFQGEQKLAEGIIHVLKG